MCFSGMLLLEPRASTAFFKFSEEWLASEPRQTCRVSALLLKEDVPALTGRCAACRRNRRRFPQLSRSWKVHGEGTNTPIGEGGVLVRRLLGYLGLIGLAAWATDGKPAPGYASSMTILPTPPHLSSLIDSQPGQACGTVAECLGNAWSALPGYKHHCVFVMPPRQVARIPRIELVYCTLDETGACAIDAPPETVKVSNKIMDCD